MQIYYYNGIFHDHAAGLVSLEDRGHQFGDGVYEVVRVYGGKPFMLAEHCDRFRKSAAAIDLVPPRSEEQIAAILNEAVQRSGLQEALVYFHATRGTAPRQHVFPQVEGNFTLTVSPAKIFTAAQREKGIAVCTFEDERWANCYIKSLNLLGNVLAKDRAARLGYDEAAFLRDGFVMEGSASNIFIAVEGQVITPSADRWILNGITRQVVLRILRQKNIPYTEAKISSEVLAVADEIFMTSTSYEIMPVSRLNQRALPIKKDGLAMRLSRLFAELYS